MKKILLPLLAFLGTFLSEQLQAQDWPDLNRFQKENESLASPGADTQRVVFMGNSITIGWKQADPELFEHYPFVNRGISGQTTPQMLIRFRQDVVDLLPKAVVILAGTNDIAENTGPATLEMILDNLKSMAEIANANGIKVILCSVLPAFEYPWRPGLDPANKIPALNAMIQDYAKAEGHHYLDYFSTMTDGKNGLMEAYTYDGVHPDKEGYAVMRPMVLEAIKDVLK